MTARVTLCLIAASFLAAAAGQAAAPKRKATAPARKPPVVVPREVLAEGICRYTVQQGTDIPRDEVRFLFRSADLALPRRGAVTPVMSYREYLQDLPEGAPEIERMVYDQEIARFDLVAEGGGSGQAGTNRGVRVQATAGLPQGREAQVLGLPWLTLSAPRAGQSWERTETLAFPRLRERFRYRVVELTTVGGRRAWRVERHLTAKPATLFTFPELQAPARVQRWQETFWVAADGSALLRAERRLRLATTDENPVALTLEMDWRRKGERPVALAEYKARATLFAQLTNLERKVQEASSRTTLDGLVDLRALRHDLEALREEYTDRRYQATFEKVGLIIDQGVERFKQQPPQQQGRVAPPFVLPDAEGRPTALAAFRGRVVLLSFWSTG